MRGIVGEKICLNIIVSIVGLLLGENGHVVTQMDMLVLNAWSESFKGHCSSKIPIRHCSRLFSLLCRLGHRSEEGHLVGINGAATDLRRITSSSAQLRLNSEHLCCSIRVETVF